MAGLHAKPLWRRCSRCDSMQKLKRELPSHFQPRSASACPFSSSSSTSTCPASKSSSRWPRRLCAMSMCMCMRMSALTHSTAYRHRRVLAYRRPQLDARSYDFPPAPRLRFVRPRLPPPLLPPARGSDTAAPLNAGAAPAKAVGSPVIAHRVAGNAGIAPTAKAAEARWMLLAQSGWKTLSADAPGQAGKPAWDVPMP